MVGSTLFTAHYILLVTFDLLELCYETILMYVRMYVKYVCMYVCICMYVYNMYVCMYKYVCMHVPPDYSEINYTLIVILSLLKSRPETVVYVIVITWA